MTLMTETQRSYRLQTQYRQCKEGLVVSAEKNMECASITQFHLDKVVNEARTVCARDYKGFKGRDANNAVIEAVYNEDQGKQQ